MSGIILNFDTSYSELVTLIDDKLVTLLYASFVVLLLVVFCVVVKLSFSAIIATYRSLQEKKRSMQLISL